MTIPEAYIGCDVSKAHLDFFDPKTQRARRIANDTAAISACLEDFAGRSVFVVYEATGAYDRRLAHALAGAQIPSCRINPTRARRFAQATGRKAKTDPLDARMLADLGARLTPEADILPCAAREQVGLLHKRRDQLVDMRKIERTRMREAADDRLRRSFSDMIGVLDEQIAAIEAAIEALIAGDEEMRRKHALLQSAPGVGPVTATTLLALMPELGALGPKAAASLAGLAPFNHDSGAMKGRRCISGGRRRVRCALYMAAMAAARNSLRFKTFYDALCARNPARKVALIAVARKLLTALNAMLRDNKAFE